MAQAAKSQEPSMEEILASIRRIIAEDDSDKSAPPPAEAAGVELNPDAAASSLGAARAAGDSYSRPPESPPASPSALFGANKATRSSTVLDLTEPIASPAYPSAVPTADSSPASTSPASIDDAAADEPGSTTPSGGAGNDQRGGLMSTATSAAVDSAFNALAQTVLVHNARTLEDLVREMLRPMLKVWLDDNLPGMVERLVRAEIERVSRGRG
jgi:hypothetical protein